MCTIFDLQIEPEAPECLRFSRNLLESKREDKIYNGLKNNSKFLIYRLSQLKILISI